MFPSKNPFFLYFQSLLIAIVIGLGMYWGAVELHNPLALMLVLGFFFMPSAPLMPDQGLNAEMLMAQGAPVDEDPGYDGNGTMGFMPK